MVYNPRTSRGGHDTSAAALSHCATDTGGQMIRRTRSRKGARSQVATLTLAGLTLLLSTARVLAVPAYSFPRPDIDDSPRHYICHRTTGPITADGQLDEAAWVAAPWTDAFVDIEGDRKPAPRFKTRAKMLWDDDYFYIAAEMEEPHVWAKLVERDAVIFYDNDFEVFIDPDSDTHEYYELEVNAFATEWDLLLTKPYRDGGTAIDSWDIQGLRTGIDVRGTLNDPSDTDEGWNVELAIPWSVLEECAHKPAPPEDGDQWRVNFSRVEWRTEVVEGDYAKITNPETGKPLPEDNWVWSPQGLINMHYPEMWGFVQFSTTVAGEAEVAFVPDREHGTRWTLFDVYYAERTYHGSNGVYTGDLSTLDIKMPRRTARVWPPSITVTPSMFEAHLGAMDGGTLHISNDGHVWHVPPADP